MDFLLGLGRLAWLRLLGRPVVRANLAQQPPLARSDFLVAEVLGDPLVVCTATSLGPSCLAASGFSGSGLFGWASYPLPPWAQAWVRWAIADQRLFVTHWPLPRPALEHLFVGRQTGSQIGRRILGQLLGQFLDAKLLLVRDQVVGDLGSGRDLRPGRPALSPCRSSRPGRTRRLRPLVAWIDGVLRRQPEPPPGSVSVPEQLRSPSSMS